MAQPCWKSFIGFVLMHCVVDLRSKQSIHVPSVSQLIIKFLKNVNWFWSDDTLETGVKDALKLQNLFFSLDDLTSARQVLGSFMGRQMGIWGHHSLNCFIYRVLCNSEGCVNSQVPWTQVDAAILSRCNIYSIWKSNVLFCEVLCRDKHDCIHILNFYIYCSKVYLILYIICIYI